MINFNEPTTIAIVLPAYNEELTIVQTITSFNYQLPYAAIWVIDNNSNDSTNKKATDCINLLGCKGGVIMELQKGKGNAIRKAFSEIDADIYVMADADLTYPANRVHDLIAPVFLNAADFVVGDRISGGQYDVENKRFMHGVGNKLVTFLINRLFNSNLKDIMSGYRVFNRLFVKNYPILVEGFEIETDMTLHALDKRFRIQEIPVEYKNRPSGSTSKLNTFSDGFRILFTIARILRYYKPMTFFGYGAIIIGCFGFIIAIPVFSDWIQYRFIYHLPLAILATGFEIVSVLMFVIGLVLDSMSYHNKSFFESQILKQKIMRRF